MMNLWYDEPVNNGARQFIRITPIEVVLIFHMINAESMRVLLIVGDLTKPLFAAIGWAQWVCSCYLCKGEPSK